MSKHQITVERPWKGLPTKQLINIETGQTEVFIKEFPFPDIKVAESGADNKWKITDEKELLKRYNTKNSKNLTGKELEKEFNNSGAKQFNNDRADIINKNSSESTKTFLATKQNPVPGTIDPKTKIEAGKTSPQAKSGISTDTAKTNAAVEAENVYKEGTREKYEPDMRYPLTLSGVQDVIKFSILKYSPSLSKENQKKAGEGFGSAKSRVVEFKDGNPTIPGSEIIGVITLPIPAGISDNNPVGWEKGELTQLQSEASKLALGFFDNGVAGAEKSLNQTAELIAATNASEESQQAIKSFFLNQAVLNSQASQRAFGAVFNNNAELLFSGPSLRQFSFTFLFYPREPNEAIMVRKIIRAFKQSMSVKRSKTSLLLKAPHTFAIKYMTANQEGKLVSHPYLNRFKECALTSCNVDYTPENTYMTYNGNEKSMTAYRLSLSFSELEPLFDDEYGQKDDNIGF